MRPSDPTGEVVDLLLHITCPEGREKNLAEEIERLEVSGEVLLIKGVDDRLALDVMFPYNVAGRRAAVLRESIYSGLFNGMRENLPRALPRPSSIT